MANRFFEGAAHAAAYARYRPHSSQSLIEQTISFLKGKYHGPLAAAADIGCGSGQSTWILAPYFTQVTGLDVSSAQINEATKKNTKDNVSFKVSAAESLPFSSESVQLITAGQACHWFDLPKFYAEADRVLVPGGVLALYGYLLPLPMYGDVSEELARIVHDVYSKDTGIYWGEDRADVDDSYKDPKFTLPLQDCTRDETHYTERNVSVTDLTGYISTWSGFQNFQAKNGDDAAMNLLENFQNRIMSTLGVSSAPEDTQLTLRYRYFIIMGRKP